MARIGVVLDRVGSNLGLAIPAALVVAYVFIPGWTDGPWLLIVVGVYLGLSALWLFPASMRHLGRQIAEKGGDATVFDGMTKGRSYRLGLVAMGVGGAIAMALGVVELVVGHPV